MAGHSKWANTKHRKARQDAKKGKIFTKLIRIITIAAKSGGDPEVHPVLKNAIIKARSENMTNDTINKAIAKGSGSADTNDFFEITYEGYGPAGIALLVSALTDNKNRTASEMRFHQEFCASRGRVRKRTKLLPRLHQVFVGISAENDKTRRAHCAYRELCTCFMPGRTTEGEGEGPKILQRHDTYGEGPS